MMAIIINQRKRAAARQSHLAIALEAPADALKFSQRPDNRRIGCAQLTGHGNRRQRIEYVVNTRQIERDR